MHSKRMFHEVIFLRYEVPRIVISDGGLHFIDRTLWKALSEVGVDHRIATPYHPQTSGQTETSNKQIKNILQKTVNQMGRSWRSKLSENKQIKNIPQKTVNQTETLTFIYLFMVSFVLSGKLVLSIAHRGPRRSHPPVG
jgi:transposase InsO family protein